MTLTKLLGGLLLLTVALSVGGGCARSTPFGADLLDDQIADYAFTDTLTVRCTVLPEDDIITGNFTGTTVLCGTLNDPQFGKTTIDLYTGLSFDKTNIDYANTRIDSVVMFLKYQSASVYGDTTLKHTLRVFQLQDSLKYFKEYYSTENLVATDEVGSVTFFPKPNKKDSIAPTLKGPVLRFKLKDSFGQTIRQLSADSATRANEVTFANKIKGLKLTCAPDDMGTGAMMAFNLNDDSYSFIRVFYVKDTTKMTADYIFSGNSLTLNKFMHISHNYDNTPVKDKIGAAGDELMYLQGSRGLQVRVELPYASKLDNIVVNKAELVLTAKDADPASMALPAQLLMTEALNGLALTRNDTLTFKALLSQLVRIPISDVLRSSDASYALFGGQPVKETVNGTSVTRYRLNMTKRFQSTVDETSSDPSKHIFYINVQPQRTSPARAILYGPKSTVFPAKLELKYTRL